MSLNVSVSHSVHRGMLSQHALQVISQHALQQGVGVPAPGGSAPGGSACSQGGLLQGGGCSQGETPRKQTATIADGTHPTGMHSCFHPTFRDYEIIQHQDNFSTLGK